MMLNLNEQKKIVSLILNITPISMQLLFQFSSFLIVEKISDAEYCIFFSSYNMSTHKIF